MPSVDLYSVSGEKKERIDLRDDIFGVEGHEHSVHSAVVMQLANRRQGTASTKTRSEVRGGGRKPWRQKGTGFARAGSNTSPLWRKGGVIFGPKPRDYSYRMNKKERHLALKAALSSKLREGGVLVVEDLGFQEPKTKRMVEILDNLGVRGKTLLVIEEPNPNVLKSARNIPNVDVRLANLLSVYDAVRADRLVFTRRALEVLEEVLG
ncbi:MAG: 50S ribosomal protein L4 [bacterium]